ncbi:MAG: GNAT family N-acetyltransferase [Bdellovibrionales bacterium]
MRTLFHITTTKGWEQAKINGRYDADTLKTEGFIHFSRPHQVLGVADFIFKGERDLVLLQIEEEALTSELKYEGEKGNPFPHLYGPLNLDAVVEVYDFHKGGFGFHLPNEMILVGETLIRRGRPGDEAEIASCHTHAWQQSYRGLVPDHILNSRPLSFCSRMKWWRQVVNGKTPASVQVAESAHHGIVGFCAAEPARDTAMQGKGEIGALYCLNEYKSKGIGAALFRAGCDHLRKLGFPAVYVWVLKDNPSVSFYRHMGGTQLPEEKLINLGGPLPEIAFEWNLSEN